MTRRGMNPGKGLLLTWGRSDPPAVLQHAETHALLEGVDVYDLPLVDLEEYRALFVGMHVDQRFVAAQRPQLVQFLARGGTIVHTGHVAYPILSELTPFVPIEKAKRADLDVVCEHAHPVFEGVDPQEMTQVRGVAGFYGRGHNPPPDNAAIINTLGPDRLPLDYTFKPAVGGEVFIHGGNDFWQYLDDGRTTARIVPQLLCWALGCCCERAAQEAGAQP